MCCNCNHYFAYTNAMGAANETLSALSEPSRKIQFEEKFCGECVFYHLLVQRSMRGSPQTGCVHRLAHICKYQEHAI